MQGFAKELSEEVKTLGIPAEVIDMKDYDPDDHLADEVSRVQREDAVSLFSKGTERQQQQQQQKHIRSNTTDSEECCSGS